MGDMGNLFRVMTTAIVDDPGQCQRRISSTQPSTPLDVAQGIASILIDVIS